jgi:hypothetical protein
MSTSVALIHVCLECFFSLKYVLVSQNMILIPIRANQQMQQSDNIAWWIRWSGRWIFSLVVDSEAQAWDCGRWGMDLAIPLGGGAAVLAGNVDVCEAARGRWGLDLAIPPPPFLSGGAVAIVGGRRLCAWSVRGAVAIVGGRRQCAWSLSTTVAPCRRLHTKRKGTTSTDVAALLHHQSLGEVIWDRIGQRPSSARGYTPFSKKKHFRVVAISYQCLEKTAEESGG